MSNEAAISKDLLHPHIRARMQQRGVTFDEIQRVMAEGRETIESKPGSYGKVLIFPFQSQWEGKYYQEKEVTVYYKSIAGKEVTLLTVIARYGTCSKE